MPLLSRCLVVAILLLPVPSFAQGAKLQLDRLNRLADKAKEVADVNLDEAMLRQAASMGGADAQGIQTMLQGLKGVYVKSFEFEGEGAYTDEDVDAIRAQLKAPGWGRIVSVREKNELTEIYTWSEGNTPGGLAIVAAEPRELTIVNLVGQINFSQLGGIQGVIGAAAQLGHLPAGLAGKPAAPAVPPKPAVKPMPKK